MSDSFLACYELWFCDLHVIILAEGQYPQQLFLVASRVPFYSDNCLSCRDARNRYVHFTFLELHSTRPQTITKSSPPIRHLSP